MRWLAVILNLIRWAIFWLISLGKMIVVQLVMRLVQVNRHVGADKSGVRLGSVLVRKTLLDIGICGARLICGRYMKPKGEDEELVKNH
jgi:hypothetical protein